MAEIRAWEMLAELPERLGERIVDRDDRSIAGDGEFVLYWMHHALRGHENPALDVAIWLARRLAKPLFVYQGLSERYLFASDRHHAFLLQGARDVQTELAARGIGAAFHLERPGHRGPHLKTLAARAIAVITEEFPTDPIPRWIASLEAEPGVPIWRVDSACVVPLPLVSRGYDRAFAFRDATRRLREARVSRDWPEQPNPERTFVPADLPFQPLDFRRADLRELIAACDIDHAVGPIPHTPGGTQAGYARWNAFKQQRLARYATDRNDALQDGVSRMSPYLHYGMVSPLRLAREAAEAGGRGAEKYLDELLVWRELAYAVCFHRPDHESLAAIPAWARETLRAHASDARPRLIDSETLARGQTGDRLWDAAQRSLLMQGELHNNVRMTWGKAVLDWTAGPEEALKRLIDLNHRYALDGRDPASYGGLLWCLGQFDRPHPQGPILGTVRRRTTSTHARRLDPERYWMKTTRPWRNPPPRVAVVGAGLAGLICGRTLLDHGFDVTLLDKARRPGGRISTRRVEPDLAFDHGAQYFTVRDANFARCVEAWSELGVIAPWEGRIVKLTRGSVEETSPQRRFVGQPKMSSLTAHLASDLPVQCGVRIERMDGAAGAWRLTDSDGRAWGPFEQVVVTLPAPQAAGLLDKQPLADHARSVEMAPCWAGLVAFEQPLEPGWAGAFVSDSPLAWVAANRSKPGRRSTTDCWTLHASGDWSAEHLERTAEDVAPRLLAAFAEAVGKELPPPHYLDAHRWRYSLGSEDATPRAVHDADQGLTLCGDWLAGGRVEGAYLAGAAAAGYLLRTYGLPEQPG